MPGDGTILGQYHDSQVLTNRERAATTALRTALATGAVLTAQQVTQLHNASQSIAGWAGRRYREFQARRGMQAAINAEAGSGDMTVHVDKDGKPKSTKASKPKQGLKRNLGDDFYDSVGARTAVIPGTNKSSALVCTLGKPVTSPDSVANLFKFMQGSAKVNAQHGGRMTSGVDERNVHFQVFRHRLVGTLNGVNNDPNSSQWGFGYPYPTTADILTPNGGGRGLYSSDEYPNNVAANFNKGSGINIVQQPFHELDHKNTYFSVFNRGDLEDMSFNLNRFKIRHDSVVNPGQGTSAYKAGSARFKIDNHPYYSSIYQWNNATVDASAPPGVSSPFKFNAVIRKGSIKYRFNNKGDNPALIELIVYRVKKNHNITKDATNPGPTDAYNIADKLVDPIAQGYIAKIRKRLGTENLDGRPPLLDDVCGNPAFPLLPQTREIIQSSNPFTEIQRVKVTLASAGRRDVVLKLPGEIYDPTSMAGGPLKQYPDTVASSRYMDEHSYVVALSVNGTLCSRSYGGNIARKIVTTGTQPNATLTATGDHFLLNQKFVGDCYSDAEIFYTCDYDEHLSACSYKTPEPITLYNNGSLPFISEADSNFYIGYSGSQTGANVPINNSTTGDQVFSTPSVQLPQERSVRVPPSASIETSSSGQQHFQQNGPARASGGPAEPMDMDPEL